MLEIGPLKVEDDPQKDQEVERGVQQVVCVVREQSRTEAVLADQLTEDVVDVRSHLELLPQQSKGSVRH